MELIVIAAVARDGAIGRDGVMPWHLPADLKHFRQVTQGHPVVMGRKTWDSLPARFRPLPGRRNVVVTRNAQWAQAGAESAASLEAALALLQDAPKVFVMGGGELYAQALPLAHTIELTEIDAAVPDADTHFPDWDRRGFEEVARERNADDAHWPLAWVTYRRREGAAR